MNPTTLKAELYPIGGNSGDDLAASNADNLTFFVQSVKFSLVQDRKGVTHLVGDVVVVNDMQGSLTNGKLWLKVNGMNPFELRPYDGSLNDPKWHSPFTIGSKQSGTIHVMAIGFKPWGPTKGTKQIGLDAKVGNETVHTEAVIKDKTSGQAAD